MAPPIGGSPGGGAAPAPPATISAAAPRRTAPPAAASGRGSEWRVTVSLPEAHVHVVEVAAGRVADVVDAASRIALPPVAGVVASARIPVAALPDEVLDPQRAGVRAVPVGDLPAGIAFGALRERAGPGGEQ